MKKAIFVLIFVTSCLFTYSQTGNWEWLNPKPSGNNHLQVLFTSRDTGFILNNSELIYTENGGDSWSIIKHLDHATDISFDGKNGVIVGNSGQVLRSQDGGKIWYEIPFDVDNFSDYYRNASCHIFNDTIYLTSKGTFYKTIDEGQNWTQTSILGDGNGSERIEFSYFLNSKVGHAFFSHGTISKTVDGGENWYVTESTTTTPSNFVYAFFVNDSVGYASQEHFDYFKTTNGGESWTNLEGNYDLARAFHFFDENNGIVAGRYGNLYSTSDGGIDWNIIELPSFNDYNQELNALHFPDDSVGYCVGYDGIILKTENGGKSWDVNSDLFYPIKEINFPSDSIGYILTRNSIYKSQDNGDSWTKLNLHHDEYGLFSMHFFNNDTGFVGGGLGYLFKTYDGGNHWDTIYPHNHHPNIRSMSFISRDTGFISGDHFEFISYTTDGGNSWTTVHENHRFDQIYFIDNQKGFGLEYGNLYKTIDGGISWNKIYEVDGFLTEIDFVNKKVGYVSAEYNTVLKTIDGGDNWIELKTEYNHLLGLDFYSSNIGFLIGEYNNVLYGTYDGGLTWDKYSVPETFTDIHIAPNNMLYGTGMGGLIVRDTFIIKESVSKMKEVDEYTDDNAHLYGTIGSNADILTDIQFEYDTNYNFSHAVDASLDTLQAEETDRINASITNLLREKEYFVRIKYQYKGASHFSDTVSFTTLPEITIGAIYVNSGSRDATVRSNLTSRENEITNIQFEYGTDTDFGNAVSAIPNSIDADSSKQVQAVLTNLSPNSDYYVKLTAEYNDEIIESTYNYRFNTEEDYFFRLSNYYKSDDKTIVTVYIESNLDTMDNIHLEYGTDMKFTNSIPADPAVVNKYDYRILYFEIAGLSDEIRYNVRITSEINNDIVISDTAIINTQDEELAVIPKSVTLDGDNAVNIGLHMTYNLYFNDVLLEYGLTKSYGDTVTTTIKNNSFDNNSFNIFAHIGDIALNKVYHYRLNIRSLNDTLTSKNFQFSTGHTAIPITEQFNISIYPNPIQDILYVTSEKYVHQISVYDNYGRRVLNKDILKKEFEYDVSSLAPGIYFIHFNVGNMVYVEKIIKY